MTQSTAESRLGSARVTSADRCESLGQGLHDVVTESKDLVSVDGRRELVGKGTAERGLGSIGISRAGRNHNALRKLEEGVLSPEDFRAPAEQAINAERRAALRVKIAQTGQTSVANCKAFLEFHSAFSPEDLGAAEQTTTNRRAAFGVEIEVSKASIT